MNKLIWVTTASILFLVFIVPGILALFIKMVPYNDQPGYDVDHRLSVYFTHKVSQKFTSQEDNLAAIGITLGNPNLKNKKEVKLDLFSEDTLVRTSSLSGLNIPDGGYVRFEFNPVTDSKGKEYVFTIQSPDAGEVDVIYVYHTKNVLEWMGEIRFNEEVFEEGKLPFVTYHKPKSKLEIIRKVYSI